MKKILVTLLVVCMSFMLIRSVASAKEKKLNVEMCCYSVGSLQYIWSAQHCKLVNKYTKRLNITPAFCGAETASVKMLATDRTDFGEVSYLELELAKRGWDKYKAYGKKSKEMFYDKIAICYKMPYGLLHFITLAKSPMKDLSDVRGKKVSLSSAACTVTTVCNEMLEVHGLKKGKDYTGVHFSCGSGRAPEACADRTIDMFECNNPGRQPSVEILAATNKIRRLSCAPGKLGEFFAHMDKKYGKGVHGCYKIMAPKGLYGKNDLTETDIEGCAYDLMLCTRRNMPEWAVYEFVKHLFDHMEEFYEIRAFSHYVTLKKALENLPPGVPIHPGAARYYYEKGVLPKDRYKDLPENIRPKG